MSLSRVTLAVLMLAITGCAAPGGRAAASSYGCMKLMRDRVPHDMSDKQQHCLASALIARHCSTAEAYLAGAGKEGLDLFTGGDPSWADWRADRVGVRCGREANDDASLAGCCEQAVVIQ